MKDLHYIIDAGSTLAAAIYNGHEPFISAINANNPDGIPVTASPVNTVHFTHVQVLKCAICVRIFRDNCIYPYLN
jgi:hypothetical protein